MRTLNEFLNEKLQVNKDYDPNVEPPKPEKMGQWVAIEVTTAKDRYHPKPMTTQRVVTLDTYNELKSSGRTKGYMTIDSISALGPVCKTRDAAANYLDPKQKQSRKSKIDKENADYVVWAITIGKLTPAGNTMYDWNLWEIGNECKQNNTDMELYVGSKWGTYPNSFLWGTAGSLKEGDTVCVVDNDSEKKLPGAPRKILAALPANSKDAFVDAFRKKFPDICKAPKRAFGKVSDGLPWFKLGQVYSIKGIAVDP